MSGVLVTGATTPIGRALIDALLEDDRFDAVLAVGAEPRWPFEPDQRLTYVAIDLTRTRGIRQLLFGPARDLGIRAVVHTALHRRVTDEGRKIRALNVDSTRALVHLAERHPTIERFVFRSFASVYRLGADEPVLVDEHHPLELGSGAPQGMRDRVEADLTVCTRMGMAPLQIVVLRCAEILAPDSGSQLYDYLTPRICFRPLGYDPMLNILSIADAAHAIHLALTTDARGVFNIPGADVLPLSIAIAAWGRVGVPVPGPALGPLYRLRSMVEDSQFRYGINRGRFHFSGVLAGERARQILGYEPSHPIAWPASAPPRG